MCHGQLFLFWSFHDDSQLIQHMYTTIINVKTEPVQTYIIRQKKKKKKLFGCPPPPAPIFWKLEKSVYCTKVYRI